MGPDQQKINLLATGLTMTGWPLWWKFSCDVLHLKNTTCVWERQ